MLCKTLCNHLRERLVKVALAAHGRSFEDFGYTLQEHQSGVQRNEQ